jgi:hypothetical protein
LGMAGRGAFGEAIEAGCDQSLVLHECRPHSCPKEARHRSRSAPSNAMCGRDSGR